MLISNKEYDVELVELALVVELVSIFVEIVLVRLREVEADDLIVGVFGVVELMAVDDVNVVVLVSSDVVEVPVSVENEKVLEKILVLLVSVQVDEVLVVVVSMDVVELEGVLVVLVSVDVVEVLVSVQVDEVEKIV
jgi:hypothetical protein